MQRCLVRIPVEYDAWQVAVIYDLDSFEKDKGGIRFVNILIFTESTPTLADISMTDKPVGPAALRSSGM